MLEAIVEQVELRSELLFGKNPGGVAGFSDDDRNLQAPRHKQWFIAEIAWRTGGIDQGHASGLAPVAAREDIEFNRLSFSNSPRSSTKGVLPDPPTDRFPTLTTGPASLRARRSRGHRARCAREPRVRRVS